MTSANSDCGTTFETPTDREIAMTHVVEAPCQLVFDAWTKPAHRMRWMRGPEGWTMTVCEIDLRAGGAWRCVWRSEDGSEMVIRGMFQEVVPPERLVSTESWGGEWPETVNTLLLKEEDGRTTVTERMLYPSKEARDAALGTGMEEGMACSFDGLAEYLRTIA